MRLTEETPGALQLGLAHTYRAEIREKTIGQSIEVIRNRIDEFGVAEPNIQSQGNDRVVVELPGIREVDRAKELIGRTAKLEFKMVDDKGMRPEALAALIQGLEQDNKVKYVETGKFSAYVEKVNQLAKGKIPEGDEIAFERIRGVTGEVIDRVPYLLKAKTEVTGEELHDAQVTYDQDQLKPVVSFTLIWRWRWY